MATGGYATERPVPLHVLRRRALYAPLSMPWPWGHRHHAVALLRAESEGNQGLMGASNVVAAYQRWAGRVPPLSMQLLAYMAVVALDGDSQPWFGMGHEALAIHAMGRPEPSESDLRAVRRAIAPLIGAGAISVERRPAARHGSPTTARYRLHLDNSDVERIDSCAVDNGDSQAVDNSDVGRKPSGDVGRKPSYVGARRRTETVLDVGRKPSYRGERRRTTTEEREGGLPTSSPTATRPPDDTRAAPTEKIDSDKEVCECGVLLDPDRTCRNRACSAAAVVVPLRRRPA